MKSSRKTSFAPDDRLAELMSSTEDLVIEVEPSLTYECLSGTIPFEKMYQSEDRINFLHQDLCTFPKDYVVVENFPKYNERVVQITEVICFC